MLYIHGVHFVKSLGVVCGECKGVNLKLKKKNYRLSKKLVLWINVWITSFYNRQITDTCINKYILKILNTQFIYETLVKVGHMLF